ncbi:hypothetical protein GCM10009121_22130 [Rhodanobacter soli]
MGYRGGGHGEDIVALLAGAGAAGKQQQGQGEGGKQQFHGGFACAAHNNKPSILPNTNMGKARLSVRHDFGAA